MIRRPLPGAAPCPTGNPQPEMIDQPCHFGEWIQGRMGPEGPVALITLLPRGLYLRAMRRPAKCLSAQLPDRAGGDLERALPRFLPRFLRDLGLPCRERFILRPPFPAGMGAGISTASLVAIARLAGFRGPPEALARACIAAEGASDPLMFPFPDRLLWASRQGRVLAHLPPPPRMQLLAGLYGPARPTRAEDTDYDDISDLVSAWRDAADASACAALASESARRCLARRGPAGDPTEALARALGAEGWAMSHSGAARALIFAPGRLPSHASRLAREAGWRDIRCLFTGEE